MNNGLTEIIVKVGKSSNCIFRNVRAYRALTFNDVHNLLLDNPEVKAVVIESVPDKEKDRAYEVVSELKEIGKQVFIYSKSNEKNAVELSELKQLFITDNLAQLHNEITNTLGVNVGIRWCKEEVRVEKENEHGLNDALTAINDIEFIEDTELPNIENKEDIEALGDMIANTYNSDMFEDMKVYTHEEHKEKTMSELITLLARVTTEKEDAEKQLKQAMDRIKVLLDVKESIEDEKDMLRNMLNDIDNDDNIIEDPVSSEELQVINNENKELKARKIELEGELKLRDDELKESKLRVNELTESINASILKNIEYESKIKELGKEIIESQQSSNAEDVIKISELEQEIDNAALNTSKLLEMVDIESGHRLVLMNLLSDIIEGYDTAGQEIVEKNIEIKKMQASVKNLENSKASTELDYQQLKNNYEYLNSCQEDINKNRDNEKHQLQMDIKLVSEKSSYFERELSSTRDLLAEKEKALTLAIAGNNYKQSERLLENNKILEESNRALINNIEFLKQEMDTFKAKIAQADKSNKSLEETNRQLKTSVLALSRGSTSSTGKIRIECNYNARGLIIPVYGSGSYGITTTAMSIARKIPSGSVLYMDMDISNPKADSWFGKKPIIVELPQIKDMVHRTGLGSLIEKGFEYVIQNEKLIFQRVLETKNGYIDYFSGVYSSIDITKLLSVQFTEFINYLGNCYNYIVVDLGRFGSSAVSNAIIKMFDDISYRSIVVTLKDKIDVRNLGLKASDEELKLEKTVWVLNMADDTKVDKLITKSIGSAKMLIMPKSMKMYGTNESYDKVLELKDKLGELIDLIIK